MATIKCRYTFNNDRSSWWSKCVEESAIKKGNMQSKAWRKGIEVDVNFKWTKNCFFFFQGCRGTLHFFFPALSKRRNFFVNGSAFEFQHFFCRNTIGFWFFSVDFFSTPFTWTMYDFVVLQLFCFGSLYRYGIFRFQRISKTVIGSPKEPVPFSTLIFWLTGRRVNGNYQTIFSLWNMAREAGNVSISVV